jgi:hypothetical protein
MGELPPSICTRTASRVQPGALHQQRGRQHCYAREEGESCRTR